MALTVYTNIYSTIAQNNLTRANNAMSKSIERLSSGLRINHAADDASGLAISEKLRAQIRGMSKAYLNAQDAVSFLQTAEGGLEVIGDMLQRMRELAVQAGNGTYTSNDRKELQKEVDQLKEEIDRICASTEYNTKKLLTGDAAGLWSASDSSIEAIIRGEPAEGNYKLTFDVDPGHNAIYKTDIMTVNRDLALIKSNSSSILSIEGSGDVLALNNAELSMTSAAATTAGVAVLTSYTTAGAGAYVSDAATNVTQGTHTILADGYLQIEFLDDKAAGSVANAGDSTGKVRVTFVNALNGSRIDETLDFNAGTNKTINLGGNTFELGFAAHGGAINAGDKVLLSVQKGVAAPGANDAQITITMTSGMTGATAGSSLTGPAITIPNGKTTGGSVTGVTIIDGEFQAGTITYKMDLSKEFADGVLTIKALKKGTVATSDVRLKDIERFTNADGRMILDNTQALTIYGNDRQATVYLEGGDTLAEFAEKLRTAIARDLDMGAVGVPTSKLVQYVESAGATGDLAVPGTFVIQSALTGKLSELKFTGDESLINALSLAQIQEAEDSDVTVTVNDAHNGKYIGSDRVSDYMLRGIIAGVDVKLNSTAGIKVAYENGKMQFLPDNKINTATGTYENETYLHIVNNRTDVQVGANEGQTFDISIGRMDTTALEIADAYVMTMKDAQKAITKFDYALERVNSHRATIGAQINRLEYTMQNLNTSKQNLIAAESRIRDLDVADESATFSRNQILVNSAVAMLAQANQLPQVALQLIGGR